MKQIIDAITDPGEVVGGRRLGVDYGHQGRVMHGRSGVAYWVSDEERHELGAAEMTNWEGRRVLIFPLFWMRGEPHYPPVHIEPGEKRREEERKMMAAYNAYRDEKKKQRGAPSGRREEWS